MRLNRTNRATQHSWLQYRLFALIMGGAIATLSSYSPVMAQDAVVTDVGSPGYNWVGDFNGDGRDDLASALPDGSVIMRMADQGDWFNKETWFVPTKWGGARYTWAEDFNGDGKTDLVSALESDIFVHLSLGTTFDSRTYETMGRWGEPGYNWSGDFNGDGLIDIASAHPGGDMTMRLANGNGFDEETWTVTTQWGGREYTWAADFNGDGFTDLVSALENQVFVHLSNGAEFTSSTIVVSRPWGEPGYNWSGDFNGDGLIDVVSALPDEDGDGNGDMIMRFFDGSEFEFQTWSVSTRWGGDNYTWAEDFNGDGVTDFASARESSTFLHLTEGDRFSSETLEIPDWGEPGYNFNGDFNGDGRMDLMAIMPNGVVNMRQSTEGGFELLIWGQ